MGGRGVSAGSRNKEVTMESYIQTIKIQNTIKEREKNAADIMSKVGFGVQGSGGGISAMKQCACCENYSIPAYTEYTICPICGWVDDPLQNKNPNSRQGGNSFSLNEARLQWRANNTPQT